MPCRAGTVSSCRDLGLPSPAGGVSIKREIGVRTPCNISRGCHRPGNAQGVVQARSSQGGLSHGHLEGSLIRMLAGVSDVSVECCGTHGILVLCTMGNDGISTCLGTSQVGSEKLY